MNPIDLHTPIVVILEPDLFFSTRFEDVVRAQAGTPITVETPQAFVDAVDAYFPVLALVDLKTPGDWEQAIRRCKVRPHTRHTPIYAFGSHVDVKTLQRARQAGADHAWARSRMMQEWVSIVQRYTQPPVRRLEGCDDRPSRAAVAGLLEFNRGHYFEQHEHLERAWNQEPRSVRELYQGILQVGVAFLQIERGNWRGALKMFRRGLPRLRGLPEECQGIHVGAFREAAEQIHAAISRGGPDSIRDFDPGGFPRIEFHNPYPEE